VAGPSRTSTGFLHTVAFGLRPCFTEASRVKS